MNEIEGLCNNVLGLLKERDALLIKVAALEAMVEKFKSTNSQSPKLPSVGKFILVGQKLGLKASVVSKLYHAATSDI